MANRGGGGVAEMRYGRHEQDAASRDALARASPPNTAITNTAAATANTSNVYLARASTYTQGDTHKQTEKNKRRNAYIRGKPSPS